MPFDALLADRVRPLLKGQAGLSEKRMFGGIGFLLHGNMCVGVWKEFLILRLGAEAGEAALRQPHVREFDITGRPMSGWVMVEPDGSTDRDDLERWVRQAADFAGSLPPKKKETKKAPKRR